MSVLVWMDEFNKMKQGRFSMFKYLQKIGQSLLPAIAVLPAAALLMGIGYWIDPQVVQGAVDGVSVNTVAVILLKAGSGLIDNMGLLFAVGIAYGISRDKNGGAALTGLVMWLVLQALLTEDVVSTVPFVNYGNEIVQNAFAKTENQFIGILVGVLSGEIYNATYKVELPLALSFFSGRRLSTIVSSVAGVVLAILMMAIWPVVFQGLVGFGEMIQKLGPFGAGLYGFFNRLLIPTGLHHALNSVFWFDVAGINDIGNFLSGQNPGIPGYMPGMYQAGFFPIMMFGVPAGALAMIQEARPAQRKRVAGILGAAALASFVTGVTEPFEFAFMFVAFPLYVVHAILTGISLWIAASMQWMAGFAFSAGLVDYTLSIRNPNAVNVFMLLIQGVVMGALYYVIFRFVIRKWNLMTPGRDPKEDNLDADEEDFEVPTSQKHEKVAREILEAIGADNLVGIDNCATRLRLDVVDSGDIDEAKIKKTGVAGIVKPSNDKLQIIVGPHVQFVADELKSIKNSKSNDADSKTTNGSAGSDNTETPEKSVK